jgi:hypothetical protein
MQQGYEVLVPQPLRRTEILRSDSDDNSRSAFIDAMLVKYGLDGPRRKFRGVTPRAMTVSVAHHGCTSVTFFHLGGKA